MNNMNYTSLFVIFLGIIFLCLSCKDEEINPCADLICQNGGICIEGICQCPVGYEGETCETEVSIQKRLNLGESPLFLLNNNEVITIDSFYGKMYKGGRIFYLDVEDDLPGIEGMVVSTTIIDLGYQWGCIGINIIDVPDVILTPSDFDTETEVGARIGDGMANTEGIVASDCGSASMAEACFNYDDGTYSDWFLPSRGELSMIYVNLYTKGIDTSFDSFAASSSERSFDSFWCQRFGFGGTLVGCGKISRGEIRPVRAF